MLFIIEFFNKFCTKLSSNTDINSYEVVQNKHNITYEQNNLVRPNLVKRGVLTSKTDLTLEKDLKAIEEAIKKSQKYVDLITNPKKKLQNKYRGEMLWRNVKIKK